MMIMIAITQMRRLMVDIMNTRIERVASTTMAPRATNMVRMETIMITSTTTITRNTSMEKVASMITVQRAINMVRMDTIMITSTTTIISTIIITIITTIISMIIRNMITSMVNPMIIRMTINMASLHLQSCLSKRGRGRRKRNLARH